MSQDFVHLHSHSTHSYWDGYGSAEQILSHAQQAGFKAMALTDHGSLDGLIAFYFEALKRDIKPILGVEAYICNDIRIREAGGVNPIKHITLLAKSARGYTSLCRLMTLAHSKEGFYRKPRIDWATLEREGQDLIVLSGCANSAVYEDERIMGRLKSRFGQDFYFEAMPIPEPGDYRAKSEAMHAVAKRMGIKTVMTGDCHYPAQRDAKIQDVMLCINNQAAFNDPERMKMAPVYWQRSLEELREHAHRWTPWLAEPRTFAAAAQATLEIAAKVDIKLGTSIPVKFSCAPATPMGMLRYKIGKGKDYRTASSKLKWSDQYEKRLTREIALIDEKNFADYFLIVSDVVGWAKKRGILVGPARGSAAGSLVCYLLGITEIDPLPFGLLFERFIDSTRYDLPDIDLDFEDRERETVIQYLKHKYRHVGVLSAWSKWGAKSCLLDVARIFNIPQYEVRKVTPLVIQRSGGDARASFTLADTFEEFPVAKQVLTEFPALAYASQLEAQVRQKTRHAAGVVISAHPVDIFASTYQDDCLSIGGAEAKLLGALKLDVLGINTLTVISEALKAIKERHGKTINIYTVPLEDDKVLAGFRSRKLAGIFQYEGGAMKSVNRRIPANRFNDLAIINAASRPGPLHCGGTALYIDRLNGTEPVSYPHKIAEDITKDTLGVVMYQEQVIKLMAQLGLMSWEDTATARKVMSGRRGTEVFNKLFDKFQMGAMRNGMTADGARHVWEQICTHGSWSFNMSHAVSYATLAYWTMWLKVYYPAEFYWASIAYTSSDERRDEVIKEWKKSGGKILQVAVDKSGVGPRLEGQAIRMGWSNISGIGEALGGKLTANAPYKSPSDLVNRTGIKRKALALLEDLGVVDRLQLDFFKGAAVAPDKALLMKHCPWLFDMDLSQYRDPRCVMLDTIEAVEESQHFTIVGVIKTIGLRDLNEVNGQRGMQGTERIQGQTKFANVILEDENDSLLVAFTRRTYPTFQDRIWKDGGIGNIIRVSGVIRPGMRKLYAANMQILGRLGAA